MVGMSADNHGSLRPKGVLFFGIPELQFPSPRICTENVSDQIIRDQKSGIRV